jgi:Sel1 repeat
MWRGALATLGVSGLLLIVFAEFSGKLSIVDDASRGTDAPWGTPPQLRDKEQSRLTPHVSSTAASPQNEASVLNQLGTRYLEGRGLERNVEMAFFLFTLAAEGDDADALNNLGQMYETGLATQRDRQRAIKFYKEAAKKGNQLARANLVRLGVQDANSTAELSVGGRTFDQPTEARDGRKRGVIEPSAKPAKPTPKVVQSNTAAVHAGETLIKPPPPARVVQSNTAALHAGATLLKWPPARVVQSNNAAVHAGETLIKPPPPARVVQSNTAALHAGATLIKPPPPAKVQTNTAAVHAGATLIKWPPPAAYSAKPKPPWSKPSPSKFAQTSEGASTGAIPTPTPVKRKTAPPSVVANASTDAVTREPAANSSKATSKARAKQRKPGTVLTATEQRKQRTNGGMTDAKNRLRSRMATTLSAALKAESRRMRADNRDEVRRAVGQLNEEDRRAFQSRCGQILSAPRKFAGSHVEICLAAALIGRRN